MIQRPLLKSKFSSFKARQSKSIVLWLIFFVISVKMSLVIFVPLQRSQSSLSQPSSSSSSSLSSLTQLSSSSGALSGSVWSSEQDRKLKQYLEDERIALFLQNQEFMKELQRNRDFLIALEIGTHTHTHIYKLYIYMI